MAKHLVELASILAGIVVVDPIWDRKITGITSDSRQVKPGDLFIAVKGNNVDATQFIETAIQQGAVAVVAEDEMTFASECNGVPIFYIPDLLQQISKMAARFHGHPSRQLHLVGITGTNGKSSCAYFIAEALSKMGESCGVIGTLGIGMFPELKSSTHTTPDAVTVVKTLDGFRDQNGHFVAIEISSHALDQGRVKQVEVKTAVFTNLSRDHLDYHVSMEAYGEAKTKLFTKFGLQRAILNADDPFSKQIEKQIPPGVQIFWYGITQPADMAATDIKLSAEGISATIKGSYGEGQLKSSLLGRFNVANLLAVLTTLVTTGHSFEKSLAVVNALSGTPGRMQVLRYPEQPTVVVDYAHTPDALEKALSALREHSQGKIICVFGCGGDRDKGKRSMMGAIAEKGADTVILTDDNPRFEDPAVITDQILSGMNQSQKVRVIHRRQDAIAAAIAEASPSDWVLIAGKGHEVTQQIKNEKFPFEDKVVAEQLLKKRVKIPAVPS